MKTDLVLMLKIAGLLHLGLICAGALMPRAVQLKRNIATLPSFIGRLFWVYYSFIALSLVSFGAISFFLADSLASGTALARAICIFLTAFWTLRLIAATFVFDVTPYLTSGLWRLGYHATNVVFAYLPLAYAWVAWKGGTQ